MSRLLHEFLNVVLLSYAGPSIRRTFHSCVYFRRFSWQSCAFIATVRAILQPFLHHQRLQRVFALSFPVTILYRRIFSLCSSNYCIVNIPVTIVTSRFLRFAVSSFRRQFQAKYLSAFPTFLTFLLAFTYRLYRLYRSKRRPWLSSSICTLCLSHTKAPLVYIM